MRRRHSVRFGSVAAAVALAAWVGGCAGAVRPRNLIVITLDTVRADRLPAYGFDAGETPALDGLAAEGVLFERAFAAVPLTLPSHASLFTGLYPPRFGVRDNAGAPLRPDFATMAETLRARGLATAAFVSSAVLGPGRGLEQGFTTYNDASTGCSDGPPARRAANEVVDDALAWLERQKDAPFFAWLHFYDAHRPYRVPVEYEGRYDDPYLEAIAFEDSQIARVVAHLESRGLLDRTLIIVAGDHGESLGDHGEEGHGIFVYQEALHVPLILRGPGILPERVSAIARLVDVMPTVLEMFGVEAPAMDGVSLSRLFGKGERDPGREVYAESLYAQRFGWAGLRSLRADRYKVIEAPRPELYDLDLDPDEQTNIFDDKPHVARAMLQRLHAFGSPGPHRLDAASAIDGAVAERIASLGYVSATSGASTLPSDLPDPKDKIDAFNQITTLQWQNRARFQSARRACGPVQGSGTADH